MSGLNFFNNSLYHVRKFVSLDIFTAKNYGVSDLLLYSKFVSPGVILNTDGSFLKSFWFRGQDLDSSTDDELAYMSHYINMAMCRLGNGWTIHLDCIRRESSGYIKTKDCHFTDATSFLIDEERRFEYNLEATHYENDYIINFTWLPPSDLSSKLGIVFLQKDQKSKKNIVNYADYLDSFKDNINSILDILKVKFKIEAMTDDEMLSYINFCVTGNQLKLKNPNTHYTDIRFVVANQDIINGFDPMIGDKYLRVISLGDNFPPQSYPTILKQLNELGFTYRWNTRYIFLSNKDASKMISKIADLHYQGRKSAGSMVAEHFGDDASHKVNRSADTYFEDAESARELIELGSVRFGKYSSSVILMDSNQDILLEKTKIVQAVINNLNFLARLEKAHCFEAYLGSLPSMVRPNVRKAIMHSTNLADLMPTTSIWAGFHENPCRYYKEARNNPPLFYASTTGNTPFRLSLHVGDIGHTLVLGSSRGGKSTKLNFIATQHMRYKNARVFHFDNGRSALPLCYAMNGTHYDIGFEDNTITFKPLEFLENREDFSFACDWLAEICELNNFTVKPQHRTIINDVLGIIRDEGKNNQRTMSYFYYQISSRDNELAQVFKPYTKLDGDNLQASLFDATENNLALSKYTVFELEQLIKKGDETLIPTIRYLFHMIERSIADLPAGAPIAIILDEAWAIFKNKIFQNIIDEWLRKIAKKNVFLVIASTQINDVLKSDISDVLIDNCKTKILLPNPEATKPYIAEIYKKFGLNDKQIDLISYAVPQRDYYYMSSLGNRMFNLNLGDIALTFLGKASIPDITRARELKQQYGDLFGYHWLKENKQDEFADIWLNKHKEIGGTHESK